MQGQNTYLLYWPRLHRVSRIVSKFICRTNSMLTVCTESGLQALDSSMPSTSSAPLTRRIIYDRLHYLLQHVLTLVPTLPSTLQPLLIRHFPHKRQNQVSQTTFIRNILRVSSYCPELSDKILATIVDRAIQIDVSQESDMKNISLIILQG